jgi:polyphosphate:AMP phosphotransferase
MLETVDLKAKLAKAEYQAQMEKLDARLGELQRAVREAGRAVAVVMDGWDAAGKGVVLGRILQALDPRGFKVYHVPAPDAFHRLHPPMWRFWQQIPARGQIAIFDHSWNRQLFEDRLDENPGGAALAQAFERVRVFERQLADDGVVIVKFFLHVSKKEQARRFEAIAKDPAIAWKVGDNARHRHKQYKRLAAYAEDMLRETSTPEAPWNLVPAHDERLAIARVAETLAATLSRALDAVPAPASASRGLTRHSSPLDRANLNNKLDSVEYERLLPKLQDELRRLQHVCYARRRPVLALYEGWDAAGKGGNIRRLTRALDPRGYEVVPFAAPAGDEKTRHYLWRFWRAVPKAGHWTIFDRSHYGRVLVERVEGFATPAQWGRAYREINEFERELAEGGVIVVKFWLHVSKAEQLRRFKDRENAPEKQWKITEEDWRNRKKWDAYWEAVSAMIERTSTPHAPWTIVEGEDKLHARVQALRTVIHRVREALGEKD